MVRSKRAVLRVECLESKILLSTGLADPARAVHHSLARRFDSGGKLNGTPSGASNPGGYTIATFNVYGHIKSMGEVSGDFLLADSFVPFRRLPNLSNAKLMLIGRHSAVELQFAPAPVRANVYHYKMVAGTGELASAFGAGVLTIRSNPASLDLTIRLHATRG